MIFLYLTTPAGAVIGVEQPRDLFEILKMLGHENPTLGTTVTTVEIPDAPPSPPAEPKPAQAYSATHVAAVPRSKPDGRRGAKPGTKRSVIIRAFTEDSRCLLPPLCEVIYGDSSGASMKKLRASIGTLCWEGKLQRVAAGEYRVMEES